MCLPLLPQFNEITIPQGMDLRHQTGRKRALTRVKVRVIGVLCSLSFNGVSAFLSEKSVSVVCVPVCSMATFFAVCIRFPVPVAFAEYTV